MEDTIDKIEVVIKLREPCKYSVACSLADRLEEFANYHDLDGRLTVKTYKLVKED